jgi:hypothetical protein
MLTHFWEGIGSKLADRWASAAAPALLFWLGGLLAYLWAHEDYADLATALDWVGRQSPVAQIALLTAILAAITTSGIVVQRLTLPALRIVEGYWPNWLRPARRSLIKWQIARFDKLEGAYGRLATKLDERSASPDEQDEFIRLDQRLRRLPAGREHLMPTRVGNILRSSEGWPGAKYGLDAVKCWPHLWLVLPDETRQDISTTRAALDSAAASCVWGLLFLVWTPWTPWAAVIGIGASLLVYLIWIPDRAEVFADLVEAAFDVHRVSLYEALRWPLPSDPADEHKSGALLTEYLWKGSREDFPVFTRPDH